MALELEIFPRPTEEHNFPPETPTDLLPLTESLLTSLLCAEAQGLFVEKKISVHLDLSVELEERILVAGTPEMMAGWESQVTDIYDHSGRIRLRYKDGKPRISVKIPLEVANTPNAKCCIRIEIKPTDAEQQELFVTIGKLLELDPNHQVLSKYAKKITLLDGSQAWLNWDGCDSYWIDNDASNGDSTTLMPPEIRIIGHDRSRVKVLGIDQYSYQDFKDAFLDNLAATSRTAKGVLDRNISEKKKSTVLDPENLALQVEANAARVCETIWLGRELPIGSPQDLKKIFAVLALAVGEKTEDDPLALRTWPVPYGRRITPEMVEIEMDNFYQELYGKLLQVEAGEKPADILAAWVEWKIDADIHPYHDGCARKAKAFSALILARFGKRLPGHTNRDKYYQAMNQGYGEFLEYYLSLTADRNAR